MAIEAKLQGRVRDWLRARECVVLVTTPGAGIPVGFPDVLALTPSGHHIALEIKASENSKRQPLQDYWVERLANAGYAAFVWPENWAEVQEDLEAWL